MDCNHSHHRFNYADYNLPRSVIDAANRCISCHQKGRKAFDSEFANHRDDAYHRVALYDLMKKSPGKKVWWPPEFDMEDAVIGFVPLC